MANSDSPFGFKPVKHLNGNPWNGKVNVYYIPSTDNTATFVGDAVKLAGSADATGKYPTVAQAAATNAICGVVVGFGSTSWLFIVKPSPFSRILRFLGSTFYITSFQAFHFSVCR